MSTDNEFTIRVTGAVPPPLPTKGKKKAAAPQKCTSQQQQQQRRYNMRLCPSTSINQLRKDVYALFNIPTDHIQSYQMSFLSGFPPKAMEQTGKATVHELGIRPNESITIRFTFADSSSNNATKDIEVLPRTDRPPKRASAKAASASFKNVIASQDAIMKNEKKVTKRKTTSTTGNISGFGNVAAAASKKSNKQPKKVKMEGSGYRLSDGTSSVDENENQEAELLLSTHGKALGIGLDRAKQRTRAMERVMGACSGNLLKFEEMKGGTNFHGGHVLGKKEDYGDDDESMSNGSGNDVHATRRFKVTYKQTVEGKQKIEEEVMIHTEEFVSKALIALNDILQEDFNEDDGEEDTRLRPETLAMHRPHIFWSLVFHFTEGSYNKLEARTVHDMIRCLLATESNVDHLNRGGRKRHMSEKAVENKNQGRGKYISKPK